ncbi:MAG: AAA family ATPase [Candidatus Eisenbacteria bacterium]|nr:AAA family ATPase [Candidatus Latescibacterota bacterium]MBD3300960.1 AAA family ATPase [Candidatus Eisenbacteria bacterium]
MVPHAADPDGSTDPRTYKVAFVGSHGVGKTTLCFELAARLKRRDLRVDLVKEVARSCPLPLNQATTLDAQAWILHKQIADEIAVAVNHDVIICDRSVLDNYAYMVQKFGRIKVFDAVVSSWITTYDLLVKVPILHAPSFDGIRDTRSDYQNEIDRRIESLLKEFRAECVRLPTWSRDGWVEMVIESLSLGTEQLGLFEEERGEP